MLNVVVKIIKISRWRESAWILGICLKGFDDLRCGNIQWINNGKYTGKKWFADPFILDYDEKNVLLLVEEFDYIIHRGRIAKLTIDRSNWTVIDCKILLDMDTHLSFPMIFRQGDEVYVCPENYQSGAWSMYRYNSSTEKLVFVQQILSKKLTDASIWKNEDNYWLLSTYEPRPNGSELTIWNSKKLKGSYNEYQRITFSENVGRNAGLVFRYGDKWIRPAQECNHVYGHSISFQELSFNNGMFSFNEIYRFVSPHRVYDAGAHTYNQFKDMAVIDVKGYRFRKIAKTINFFSTLLVRIGVKKPFLIQ